MNLAAEAIVIAKNELGNQEMPLGSNWGTHVKKYLASVGINFPASWCMAFVYWVYSTAAKRFGVEMPLYKSGGVLKTWQSTPEKYRVFKDPNPGDIFIMDMGKGLGHTGIVVKVDPTFIYTIEGNTNDTGSREGIEVAARQRTRKSINVGYLRVG